MWALGNLYPPSKWSRELTNYLSLFALLLLIFAVFKAIVLGPRDVLIDLLMAGLVFLGSCLMNYMTLAIYVFLSLFILFDYMVKYGVMLQKGQRVFTRANLAMNLVSLFSGFFSLAGMWLCYEGYKEFKAVAYGFPTLDGHQNPEYTRIRPDEPPGPNYGSTTFEAFAGSGVQIG
jgi:hypothetical protein